MTGVVALLCTCGVLASPLVFLVSGLPRVTCLLRIRDENVARWQTRAALSFGSAALLGLLVVLLA